MHFTSITILFTACILKATALFECKGGRLCTVDSEKRGVIEYDSQAPTSSASYWVLQSTTATTFLLHLSQLSETIAGTDINNGGLSISYYSKTRRGMWVWSRPSKLLQQEHEILFIKNVKTVYIVWSRRRRNEINFKLNYHVGCNSAFGDSVKLEKKFGSDEACWVVVPKSGDFEMEKMNTRGGVYETVKAVETQDSYGTLQNIHVVGDAQVKVTNLAPGYGQEVEVKQLEYDGKQENIPVHFPKSEISVNKAKVTAAVVVYIQCDNNQQDCRETTFDFSMRALSSKDQSCIEREMQCRLNGTNGDGCADDLIAEEPSYGSRSYPVVGTAENEVTSVKRLSASQCETYSDILSDMLATNETGENEGESQRYSRQLLAQCNSGALMFTYCGKSFNCDHMLSSKTPYYNPTCHSWCRFLKTFYCHHFNRYRLF